MVDEFHNNVTEVQDVQLYETRFSLCVSPLAFLIAGIIIVPVQIFKKNEVTGPVTLTVSLLWSTQPR